MIPPDVLAVLSALEARGHTAYAVGGCVRDILLGREPKDWDIATSAPPGDILSLPFETAPKALQYGAVTVRTGVRELEVTTFRRESGYSDHRRPDHVEFCREPDLVRRDFTINAILMDRKGCLNDPFLGKNDLENRVLRTVNDPFLTFEEDALRILRALRFCFSLGFTLEERTKEALIAHIDDLRFLTKTAIINELRKFII